MGIKKQMDGALLQKQLGERMTETAFAALVGRNQSTVSRWISDGVLTPDAAAETWIGELIDHLAEQAAGRRGDGDLDLVQERARLAAAQTAKIEFDLRKARGDFVPGGVVATYWNRAGSIVRQRMLSLPHRFKSICPGIATKDIAKLDDLVREILTEIAASRLPPEAYAIFKAWENYGKEPDHPSRAGEPGRAGTPAQKKTRSTRKARRGNRKAKTQRRMEGVRAAEAPNA